MTGDGNTEPQKPRRLRHDAPALSVAGTGLAGLAVRTILAALALVTLALPAAAAAQERAAVVSMGGSGGIDAAIYARAVSLFEERLHSGGFEVDTSGTPRLPDACHQACRDEERRARELDVLVVLTLEADGSSAPTRAIVSVIDALAEYTEHEDVAGRDPALVAELVIVRALGQRERGRHPWLSVTGTPEAAYVSIDGHDVGLVPWEGEVEPGDRDVRVHLTGYEPFTSTVTAAPGAPALLEVALRATSRSDDTRRIVALSTGIPLVAAGIVLVSMGGAYASRSGECVDSTCTAGYVFGDTEAATLGVGVSSLVIGGVFVFLGAF